MNAVHHAERLLMRFRPHEPRLLSGRERGVELLAAAGFVAGAILLAAASGGVGALPLPQTVGLFVAYVIAARVTIWCGPGSTTPTELVLVPALFILPPAAVPILVAAGACAAALPDVLARREQPMRLVCTLGDAWHALAPAAVVAAAGSPSPEPGALWVLGAALAAQFATDAVVSVLRERFGRGVRARDLTRVLLIVCAGDLVLAPIGWLAALASVDEPAAPLLVLPLLLFLGALTRDRNLRLVQVTERIDALRREQRRVTGAIRRVGEALGSTLEREALVELVEATAADALDADPRDVFLHTLGSPWPDDELLRRALGAAPPGGECCELREGQRHVLAHVLPGPRGAERGALAVARDGAAFDSTEHELLGWLAGQAAIGLENATLHELASREAVTDGLTGLPNRRAFRARLEAEAERARRHGLPLALALCDLDRFKRVNDTWGHPEGDRTLEAVARALDGLARGSDFAARHGGEEMVLLMPQTGLDGALTVAERARREIESLAIPRADGGLIKLTASFGVASQTGAAADPDALIAAADAALYAAKQGGRNRVCAARPRELASQSDR